MRSLGLEGEAIASLCSFTSHLSVPGEGGWGAAATARAQDHATLGLRWSSEEG